MQNTEQMVTWEHDPMDCDGCGNWILPGDQAEVVDEYYFCCECAVLEEMAKRFETSYSQFLGGVGY